MAARSGIMPGLGRGPPGRGAAGRGPAAPGVPGRDCGRGMPWLGANGLLPGRAASRLSRGRPMPWLGANGLLPGRGAPGRAAPGRSVSPSPRVVRAAGASGTSGTDGRGPGVGALGPGTVVGALGADDSCGPGLVVEGADGTEGVDAGAAAGAGAARALGPGVTGAVGALGREGAGVAGADGPAGRAGAFTVAASADCGNSSLSLRTTGGSIVDDAERTNSPCSLRWVSSVLLSTPSSLASSYTRTLATFLLFQGPRDRISGGGPLVGGAHLRESLIENSSEGAHTRHTRLASLA